MYDRRGVSETPDEVGDARDDGADAPVEGAGSDDDIDAEAESESAAESEPEGLESEGLEPEGLESEADLAAGDIDPQEHVGSPASEVDDGPPPGLGGAAISPADPDDDRPRFGPVRLDRLVATDAVGELWEATLDDRRPASARIVRLEEMPESGMADALRELGAALGRVAGASIAENLVATVVAEPECALVLAWERRRGTSLRDAADELSPRLAVRLVADAARALGEAHVHGVSHLALSPDRLLVSPGGAVVVTEIGTAGAIRLLSAPAVSELAAPPYAAPEILEGDLASVGPTADVYALGATLVELLGGTPPDDGNGCAAEGERSLDLEALLPEQVDDELRRTLARTLSAERSGRPGDLEELARGLEAWLGDDPVAPWFPPADPDDESAPAPQGGGIGPGPLPLVPVVASSHDPFGPLGAAPIVVPTSPPPPPPSPGGAGAGAPAVDPPPTIPVAVVAVGPPPPPPPAPPPADEIPRLSAATYVAVAAVALLVGAGLAFLIVLLGER